MRVWIVVIPCAYLALLLVLAAPLIGLAFHVNYLAPDVGEQLAREIADPHWRLLREVVANPWSYLWLGVLVVAQVALLLPCGKPADRPRARRRLLVSLMAAAFLIGLLFACLGVSLVFGIAGDDPLDLFDAAASGPIFSALGGARWVVSVIVLLSPVVTAWALWWWILIKATRGNPSSRFPARAVRWLLVGSVLELIVAVPCHVATRNRDDCCAPYPTFFGMATGIAVALLCCGPALLLLVRDRLQRKRPRARAD